MRALRLLPLAALVLAIACRDATAPRATLVATATRDGLVLINHAAANVDFVSIAADTPIAVDWIMIPGPGIAPGERATVRREQILGLGTTRGAVMVLWWGVRPKAGGGWETVAGVGGQLRVEGL